MLNFNNLLNLVMFKKYGRLLLECFDFVCSAFRQLLSIDADDFFFYLEEYFFVSIIIRL